MIIKTKAPHLAGFFFCQPIWLETQPGLTTQVANQPLDIILSPPDNFLKKSY